MQAHKLNVQIAEDNILSLRLPFDFPRGSAEVIILARDPQDRERTPSAQEFRQRLSRLEAEGRVTRPLGPCADLVPLATKPGALKRFLEDRDAGPQDHD
jgi:hypothetical protein